MYHELENGLDPLIAGLMNGFVMWLTIVFAHYVYVHLHHPAENQIAEQDLDMPILPEDLSFPYSIEILIPVTFSLLILLQVQPVLKLRAIARELNLSGYSKQSKPTLIKRITQEQQRLSFCMAAVS
jgi:hypothetical protein